MPPGWFCRAASFPVNGRLGHHLQATGQQQLQHHRAAVGLQLQHVFAGEGVRAGKVQGQSVVDGLACAVPERQVVGGGRRVRPSRAVTSGCNSRPDTRTMPTAPGPERWQWQRWGLAGG